MIGKLLTEHHLEFLSLIGGCAGSFESTLIKLTHCWKYHVFAHITAISMYICYTGYMEHLSSEL